MYKSFDGCRIESVRWDDTMRILSFIITDRNGMPHPVNIQTRKQRLKEELVEIAEGRRVRGIFACGMTDIDMWVQSNGAVLIEWSPCESQMFAFRVPRESFAQLVNWAKEES